MFGNFSSFTAPSLTLLSLFLSFMFCPTSFQRQWAAFLGAWCPLPALRSCFVEFPQHSNDLSINFLGRKWYPHPIPLLFSVLFFPHMLLNSLINKCRHSKLTINLREQWGSEQHPLSLVRKGLCYIIGF